MNDHNHYERVAVHATILVHQQRHDCRAVLYSSCIYRTLELHMRIRIRTEQTRSKAEAQYRKLKRFTWRISSKRAISRRRSSRRSMSSTSASRSSE